MFDAKWKKIHKEFSEIIDANFSAKERTALTAMAIAPAAVMVVKASDGVEFLKLWQRTFSLNDEITNDYIAVAAWSWRNRR